MSDSFATPWTIARQASLSMGFSRQEYWSGLPFPPLGDLSDPGIELESSALAGGFFTTEPLGKHLELTGTHTKLCNILPIGYQRILISTAPSGYCKWSLQISMMLYMKNIQNNSGKWSVVFNTGFCDETSVL